MFDWITGVLESTGAPGVALLMLLENVFPPIPSELVMPLAGYTAARGEQSLWLLIAAGTAGSLAGATLWYWVGAALGAERLRAFAARHGRWLTLSPDEFDRAEAWFGRHGRSAVLIGRLVPGVRTLISVPAGVAGMPLGRFLMWSLIGTVVWTALLASAGYALGSEFKKVSDWIDPVSNVIVAVLISVYLYRVVTFDASDRSVNPD